VDSDEKVMNVDLRNMEATRTELAEAANKARSMDFVEAVAKDLAEGLDAAGRGCSESPQEPTNDRRTRQRAKRKLSKTAVEEATTNVEAKQARKERPNILVNLAPEVLAHILSYLSFDETANARIVCQRMNQACKARLNFGFKAAERFHALCSREVKAKLPRRESERRAHPLARHCEILSALETRISLLSMTFHKYIDFDLCCFIPGKVLDELFAVLRKLHAGVKLATPAAIFERPFEVLKELRDLSSMAMEHFDEAVVPTFNLGSSSGFYAAAGSSLLGNLPSLAALTCASPASSPASGARKSKAAILRLLSPSSSSASTPSSKRGSFCAVPSASEERLRLAEARLRAAARKSKKRHDETAKLVKEQGQMIQDQGARIASLEGLLAGQQAVIAGQADKLKEFQSLAERLLGQKEAKEDEDGAPAAKRARTSE